MKPIASNLAGLGTFVALSTGSPSHLAGAEETEGAAPDLGAEMEESTRLQIFLDRAQFGPGKIDGQKGQFTEKALRLYRESLGEQANEHAGTDDLSGLDLASVDPLFIVYTVTPADMANLGEIPETVEEQAKLSSMPYETVIEVIAEKFHADAEFLGTLNPERNGEFSEGDTVYVPNVVPFDLASVPDLQVGSKIGVSPDEASEEAASEDAPSKADESQASGETDESGETAESDKASERPQIAGTSVEVNTETSILTVREDGKLVAAYPVTLGSAMNESPLGDWKVTGIAKMPDFRHDESMLESGVRGDEFNIIPAGPNNPVGVIWIALNKEGIGLHGTSSPDSIGRSASHGCWRMANWDAVRLAERIKPGVPVLIQ